MRYKKLLLSLPETNKALFWKTTTATISRNWHTSIIIRRQVSRHVVTDYQAGGGQFRVRLCAEKYATFTLWHIRHTQISFRCRMAPVMTLIKASKVSTHGHFLARTSSYTFLPSLARSLHRQEKERSREGRQQTDRQTAAQKRECWQIKRVSRWRYLRFVINKFRNRQKDALLVDK